MSNSIPTRRQNVAAPAPEKTSDEALAAPAPAPAPRSLAGRYRVREGYIVSHGNVDENGKHKHSRGGEVVELTHEEALSVIRLTKDQKDLEGRPNGPAIETEDAYNARVEAQRQHDEFLKSLSDMNSLPT
jgi:hypothetical protein